MNIKKQKIQACIALIDRYTDLRMSGLHIILDDCNYKDTDISFCITQCDNDDDYIGYQIASLLKEFTPKERKKIIENPWEFSPFIGEHNE